ncbi:MAG: response regulator [Xenococcaceae cyanobacterium MO_188.B19]|nr:response regulator [Xenococcaceae cyanobacterium MO_188.B19]
MSTMSTEEKFEAIENKNVLLVEDTLSYQELMSVAFEENNISDQLHIVENGEEALKFLRRESVYKNAPIPDLILLDLDLPKIHGYELLKTIKGDEKLKLIPVIIFTSSTQQKDIWQSYDLQANCYLSKPYDLEDFLTLVQRSLNFWLHFSQIPDSRGYSEST